MVLYLNMHPQLLPVKVVQPVASDPAESARRLREIADIGLAGAWRGKRAATPRVVPAVTPATSSSDTCSEASAHGD